MATAMSSRSSKSREDLLILFGFDETKSTELQKNWAKEHREYFQAVLSSKLGKMGVLQSNSIKNKRDYLYSMKVYEARLNRANLVGNFNWTDSSADIDFLSLTCEQEVGMLVFVVREFYDSTV